jgi:hypothetical protein
LGGWNPKPTYGCVFGSAARGDGDVRSDIDLLLIRAPVTGETDPRRGSPGLTGVVAGYASEFIAVQLTSRQASKWARQVERLHELVPAWTGNPLQVVEMSTFEWADHRSAAHPVVHRNRPRRHPGRRRDSPDKHTDRIFLASVTRPDVGSVGDPAGTR